MARYLITTGAAGRFYAMTRRRRDAAGLAYINAVWREVQAHAGLDTQWGLDAYQNAVNTAHDDAAYTEVKDRFRVSLVKEA